MTSHTYTRARVLAALGQHFSPAEVAAVLATLDTYGVETYERERERVQLAIITLAGGDREQLAQLVSAAKRDYRDVLWWADSAPGPG